MELLLEQVAPSDGDAPNPSAQLPTWPTAVTSPYRSSSADTALCERNPRESAIIIRSIRFRSSGPHMIAPRTLQSASSRDRPVGEHLVRGRASHGDDSGAAVVTCNRRQPLPGRCVDCVDFSPAPCCSTAPFMCRGWTMEGNAAGGCSLFSRRRFWRFFGNGRSLIIASRHLGTIVVGGFVLKISIDAFAVCARRCCSWSSASGQVVFWPGCFLILRAWLSSFGGNVADRPLIITRSRGFSFVTVKLAVYVHPTAIIFLTISFYDV